jgi:hypothetical protein
VNGDTGRRCRPHVPDTVPGKRVQVPERVRKAARPAVKHPRWEPYAGKPHVRFLCGGRPVMGVLTAIQHGSQRAAA